MKLDLTHRRRQVDVNSTGCVYALGLSSVQVGKRHLSGCVLAEDPVQVVTLVALFMIGLGLLAHSLF